MNVAEELQKLEQLRRTGALTEEEFAAAKARVLSQAAAEAAQALPVAEVGGVQSPPTVPYATGAMDPQTRQWAMFLHLSLLAGFVVPGAGLVLPIILWQVKKAELPGIDAHGKNVVNWLISEVIYAAICIPLVFVIIGVPMLIALGIIGIIFPILGGLKANEGKLWKYPLSITFLK